MHDHTTARRRGRRYRLGLALLGVLTIAVAGACIGRAAPAPENPAPEPGHPVAPPGLTVTPTSATLDASAAAGGFDFETFTVTQTGDGSTGTLTAEIQNEAGAPDFDLGTDNCTGNTLRHDGDSCDVAVTYTNNTGAGQGTAELVVSGTAGSMVRAALTGNGVA